jgi:hypothetical protein
VKSRGLRGKYSPLNDATHSQLEAVNKLYAQATAEGKHLFEVRYSTYIGPGCAAERGAITVCTDGKIWHNVEKNGQLT